MALINVCPILIGVWNEGDDEGGGFPWRGFYGYCSLQAGMDQGLLAVPDGPRLRTRRAPTTEP